MDMTPVPVALSTSCVYPDGTTTAFELARDGGFDGIELMVGLDPVAEDIDAVERLRDHFGVAVVSVHAPTLLATQNVWGSEPWGKLEMSAHAARRLGADTVVVHPPFRWQGRYGNGFVDGIARLNAETGIRFCVENMYPWRVPGTGGEFKAYLPTWDPSLQPYEHLTLDLSHASTARQNSRELVAAWGDRLRHLHLTDGSGSFADEHLAPGEGDQDAAGVLSDLARAGFDGHIVLEVSTRGKSREDRMARLIDARDFTRRHFRP